MGKKKTNEEFVKEIYNLVGDEYTFLEDYVNTETKIECRHNGCGYVFLVKPQYFLKGTRCPRCANKKRGAHKRKSNEDFVKEVYHLVKNEYDFLEKYVNGTTKILCKHNTCGYKWKICPSNFLRGSRCPNCYGIWERPNEEFAKRVYRLIGNEYTFLDEYITGHTKIKVRHNSSKCNYYEYFVSPISFTNGKQVRCPKCAGVLKKTDTEFKKEVYELVEDEYTFLEDYNGALRKIDVIHNICNYKYKVKPSFFLEGGRCPRCRISRGELKILNFLSRFNIDYETQYRIDECRNINPLPFDFMVFDKQKNTKLLIEYDGEQHFSPIRGSQKAFEMQQERDDIKSSYCISNNIPLLRIPYWEIDFIEHILFDKLVEIEIIEEIIV